MRAAMLIGRPGSLRLAMVSLFVIAMNLTALAAFQGATAFADTGVANADTGSPATCDQHHNLDCSNNQLSVSESGGQGDVIDGVYPWGDQLTTNWQCDAGLFGFCLPF